MSAASVVAFLRRRYEGDPTDDALLRAYSDRRDAEAFRSLVERHGPLVLRSCRRALGDAHAAEDAFQATFLILARRAGSVRRPEALAAWLFGVARRVCGNARVAAERRRAAEARAHSQTSSDSADVLSARELLNALDAELDRLPARYRLPLLLVYWQGLTHADAARELGLTSGALHGRLVRGRAKLAGRLKRRGFAPSTLLAAPLSLATVSSELVATTAALATDPWSKAPRAAVLASAATLTSSKLTPVMWTCAALAGMCLLTVATAIGTRALPTMTAAPAAQAPETPRAQVARAPTESATRISGVVVDDTGRPVAGAKVNGTWLRRAADDATTAADGSFSLQLGGPTISSALIRATSDGDARQGLARFDESFGPTPMPLRIVLKPARVSTIRVSDSDGKTVEGAAVEVLTMYGPLVRTFTDALGRARLRLPADADVSHVSALKSGVGFDYFGTDPLMRMIGEPSPLPAEVSLTLDASRRVEVKAVDSTGRPVAGVTLGPFFFQKRGRQDLLNLSGNDATLATTDAAGIARFDWIPKRAEGPIGFGVRLGEHSAKEAIRFDPSEHDATVTVSVHRDVRVQGKVYLPDGAPAVNVLLHAQGSFTDGAPQIGHFFTRTLDDGSYAISVFPGQTYAIALLDPRGAATPLTGIKMEEGVPRDGLDFRMSAGAPVRGRVTRNAGGKPGARERVTIEVTGSGDRRPLQLWAMTDDEGRYATRLSPGQYYLSAGYSGLPGARPIKDIDPADIRRAVADLDNEMFAVRDRAFRRLQDLGSTAAPELRETLRKGGSSESRRRIERLLDAVVAGPASGEPLRALRAVTALERAGTPDARRLLKDIAAGAVGAWLTQQAKASLDRLK
jgi:RNA polymerase sigma factor (sigma-70 family)